MIAYATLTEVEGYAPAGTFNEVPDAQVTQLIGLASMLMRRATRLAIYDVNPAGMPTDPEIIAAFRDATCAQVQAWVEAGVYDSIMSSGAAMAPVVKSSSDNGASVTFDSSSSDSAKAWLLSGGLATMAEMLLESAGLIPGFPGVVF